MHSDGLASELHPKKALTGARAAQFPGPMLARWPRLANPARPLAAALPLPADARLSPLRFRSSGHKEAREWKHRQGVGCKHCLVAELAL